MGFLAQMVLSFKVETADELLTENAGLALFGEFVCGLELDRRLRQEMPKSGSGRGYQATAYARLPWHSCSMVAGGRWRTFVSSSAALCAA